MAFVKETNYHQNNFMSVMITDKQTERKCDYCYCSSMVTPKVRSRSVVFVIFESCSVINCIFKQESRKYYGGFMYNKD